MYRFSEEDKLNLKMRIMGFQMVKLSLADYNRQFDLLHEQAAKAGVGFSDPEEDCTLLQGAGFFSVRGVSGGSGQQD